MKLIVRFSPVLAALALAMACGDDDDATSNATCKSPYADRTEADLKKQTRASAACANDSAAICGNDVITITSMCAQNCFTMNPSDMAKQASCTQECLKGAVSLKIPRFRGHPNRRENAPGVIHGQEEKEA